MFSKTKMEKKMRFRLNCLIIGLIMFTIYVTKSEESDIKWIKSGHLGKTQIHFVSSDGEYVITSGGEKTLKVINTKNDSLEFYLNKKEITLCANLSKDKSKLMLLSSNDSKSNVKLTSYDILTNYLIDSLNLNSTNYCNNFNLSDDQKYIAALFGTKNKKVFLWDAKTGLNITRFDSANHYNAYNYNFSPDNNHIAIVYDSAIKIYDYKTNLLVKEIEIKSNSNGFLKYNHDGTQLITYDISGNYTIYDAQTFEIISSNKIDGININQILFTKVPEKILIISSDKKCYIWDYKNNKIFKILSIDITNNNLCLFNYENELLYVSGDKGDTRVWNINSDKLEKYLTNGYHYLFMFNEGKKIYNKSIIYSTGDGKAIDSIKNNIFPIKNTNIFGSYNDSIFYFHDANSFDVLDSINFHQTLGYLMFSDNLKYCNFVSSDNHGESLVMDIEKKTIIYKDSFEVMKYSNNNQYGVYVNTSTNQLIIIDFIENKIINKIDIPIFNVRAFSFSPDNKYCFIQKYNENSKMYNLSDMSFVKEFKSNIQPKYFSFLEVTPDSKYLVDASENVYIRIWDIESGELIHEYKNYNLELSSMYISPDSKYILAGYKDGTAILYNAKFGTTSIEDNIKNDNSNLSIIPNPTDGNLKLTISNLENEIVEIKIINQEGLVNKTFSNIKINSNLEELNLNISELPAGVYIVNIMNSNINISNKTVKL